MTWLVVFSPGAAKIVRSLAPDLKRAVREALRAIVAQPDLGKPLVRELLGLYSYRVRRYRIVYALDRSTKSVQVVAVGHRDDIYESLSKGTGLSDREVRTDPRAASWCETVVPRFCERCFAKR
jgi:mRNA-degrading endonuclease RelE of RelBE toxin-antitoxin system